jgi:hypothetical protein
VALAMIEALRGSWSKAVYGAFCASLGQTGAADAVVHLQRHA